MGTLGPLDAVAERIVGTVEAALRIVADRETVRTSAGADRLDRLIARLPDIDAQVVRVDRTRRRATNGVIELIADDEVIQQAVAKAVRLGYQRVVILDIRTVCVGQQVLKIEDRIVV